MPIGALPPERWSAAMDGQAAVPDDAMRHALLDGFGADAAGEDRFDSVLGVLCVLNVLAGTRPDTAPDDPWIQRWEGWVLGQTALPKLAGGPDPSCPDQPWQGCPIPSPPAPPRSAS